MATAPTALLLRHIRHLAAGQNYGQWSDRQLLERFASLRDEAAFGALLRRHGGMVFRVSRRVLGNWHDAEDVFQAAFLLLAQKAASARWHESVANWLYQVTYHLALKAKIAAARRSVVEASLKLAATGERRIGSKAQEDPLADLTGRELQAVLDQELARLPEKYRAPLVLCYLEGSTRDEAAQRLGWPVSTLRLRLEQGRNLLRNRLARRGLVLSTALSAALLTESNTRAALPAALVSSTARAASGVAAGKATATLVSAPVAALVGEGLKALFVSKLKLAAALLLAVSVLATGAGMLTHQVFAGKPTDSPQAEAPQPPPKRSNAPERPKQSQLVALAVNKQERAATASAPETEIKEKMTVTGRVIDTAGKPVPNADVAVMGWAKSPLRSPQQGPSWPKPLGQGKTDGQGRFRLIVPQTSKERFWNVFLLARAPGHALGRRDIDAEATQSDAEVRLPQEQIFHGRLLDLQGQSAVGVKVDVGSIMAQLPEDKHPSLLHFRYPPQGLSCWPEPATTDAQGRFSLRGLASSWTLTIHVQHDRFARQELEIKPKDKDKRDEVTRSLAPARVIEGDVTYADTGKPVPNARLVIQAQKREYDFNSLHWLESQADDKGRFRVIPHVGNYFAVIAYPPTGEPYLLVWKDLNWPKADVVKQEVHLALPRGILVRGTVTELPSGKPVAGARVEFEPYHDNNPFYRSDVIPQFRADWGQVEMSGPDGKFELTVLPGPCHLLMNGPTLDYIHAEISSKELFGKGIIPNRRQYPDALVALNLKPDAGTHELAVTLRRGATLTGNVVGPDGKPVAEAVMLCRSYIPYGYDLNGTAGKEVKDGRFELPGCDPEKSAEAFFFDAKNRLGSAVKLSGKQAGQPVTIQLQPCGSAMARFVDENGKPAANVEGHVEILITPGIHFADYSFGSKGPTADTVQMSTLDPGGHLHRHSDAQGRITLPSLIPGATYWMVQHHPFVNLHKEFKVEPGKTLDLGDITVKPRKRGVP